MLTEKKVVTNSNKEIVQRLLEEVINEGRTDIIDELFSDEFYDHDPLPGTTPDLAGLKQRFALRQQAFPDFRATALQVVAEGAKVVVLMHSTGTHLGDFAGLAPTGKEFEIFEMHSFRISHGKIAEHWGITDMFGLLEQLGQVAAPWVPAASA